MLEDKRFVSPLSFGGYAIFDMVYHLHGCNRLQVSPSFKSEEEAQNALNLSKQKDTTHAE